MSYALFTKPTGVIGVEPQTIAVGADYVDLLEEAVNWAASNKAELRPLMVHAVAALSLYKPMQGWEATLPAGNRILVAINEEDDQDDDDLMEEPAHE